ncbi:hypothetical protein NIES806_01120 [Dolichospermum compactum NIES-806]|uniref:Uncharacterized protein n=1 Tax=Dolichospermum compactum NIES-806 TaxID=1973481 RepID=A0A1Z4UXC6_9CYAN|nr:hypothetical protein NIES806_01120 [Dolichospermum compactum NIES-806]
MSRNRITINLSGNSDICQAEKIELTTINQVKTLIKYLFIFSGNLVKKLVFL